MTLKKKLLIIIPIIIVAIALLILPNINFTKASNNVTSQCIGILNDTNLAYKENNTQRIVNNTAKLKNIYSDLCNENTNKADQNFALCTFFIADEYNNLTFQKFKEDVSSKGNTKQVQLIINDGSKYLKNNDTNNIKKLLKENSKDIKSSLDLYK